MQYDERDVQKESQIYKKFESLFKMHGMNAKSLIDENVWFLRQNKVDQSSYYQTTPSPNHMQTFMKAKRHSKITDILLKCNINRNQNEDLSQMSVNVGDFIITLVRTLCDLQSSVEISDENINKNDSLAKQARITEIIKLLKNKAENQSKLHLESKMQISLISMVNFPSSPYKGVLVINSDLGTENNNEILSDIFHEDSFTLNSLIDISQSDETVLLKNQRNIHKNGFNFPEYIFGALENNSKNLLVDRRMNGTTFSNFKLRLQGKTGSFESQNEYFLHLILSSVDELCDLNKEILIKTSVLKMKKEGKEGNKGNEQEKELVAGLEMVIELDTMTRIAMLRRIKELISIPIDTKTKCLMDIDEIMTDFFPEIKDSVMNLLSQHDENRGACCSSTTGCLIM